MMSRKIFMYILVLMFAGSSAAVSVGVAPAYTDLGTVERGETAKLDIYLTTGSDTPFRVNPSFRQALGADKFGSGSTVPSDQVSEQDIEDWISFSQDNFAVIPNESNTVALGGGTLVSSNGRITMYIDVPEEGAEPGYHLGSIKASPVTGGDTGFGASVNALSRAQFSFRVPGDAERQVQITDVNAFRVDDSIVRIDTRVENTGTVTTSTNSTRLLIENYVGENVENLDSEDTSLQPGEAEWISTFWEGEDVDEGEYTLKGSVNYMTGSAFTSESFSITDYVNVQPVNNTENQSGEPTGNQSLPLWLVVMFLILVGVLMYSFEIDPMWIMVFLAFLATSIFILISDVSNLLLVGLLTAGGIIVYYVA